MVATFGFHSKPHHNEFLIIYVSIYYFKGFLWTVYLSQTSQYLAYISCVNDELRYSSTHNDYVTLKLYIPYSFTAKSLIDILRISLAMKYVIYIIFLFTNS